MKNVKNVAEILKKAFKNIDRKTLALICLTFCFKPNDVSAVDLGKVKKKVKFLFNCVFISLD